MIMALRNKKMRAVLVAALVNLFLMVLGSSGNRDRDYLLVVPRVLRGGNTVNIGVNIFGKISCDVEVSLQGHSQSSVLSQAMGHFQPNQPGILRLKVPLNPTAKRVIATICGVKTVGKDITYQAPSKKIFIQTDKPIYKPGQKVLIRIIFVDSDLKPAGSKVSSVIVQEPGGSKIMKWSDIKLQDGIASLELPLSKEPVLGKWKIIATIEELSAIKDIEIDKYVLPKFELKIKPPSYLAFDQKNVPVSICARYTYGKDVTGWLETTMCLKHHWSNTQQHYCVSDSKNITGCQDLDAIEIITSAKKNGLTVWNSFSYSLNIKATFTEISTGVEKESETTSSRMKRNSKSLSFVGLPQKFKPGIQFQFKVKISYLDGKLVTDGVLKVAVSSRRFNYFETNNLFHKTYTVKNGFVVVAVEDMPHDTKTLNFQVNYNPGQLSIYATSEALYSPSLSYLKLVNSRRSTAKVGGQGSLKVLYTARAGMRKYIDFYHKIMCRGNLVLAGVTKEDLSGMSFFVSKTTSTHPLNSTSQPTRPATTTFPTTESAYSFYHIRKPIIREFKLKFNITQEMVPACRILVYYVRSDRETVGDSIVYDIEDKLENQVSISFNEKQKKPGEKTKIIMKAKPGSRIAISALDKSVLLLRSANEIKQSEVLSVLELQDVGRKDDYNTKCLWSWNRPLMDDVSQAFNTAGVVFLSNLNIFTLPCSNNYPTTMGLPSAAFITELWRRPPTREAVTDAVRTEAITTEITATKTKSPVGKTKPIKKVKVRKNFPETWLWTDIKLNDTSGMQKIEVQVPDSITSWVANGFAMSSLHGMAVSDRAILKTFQPFFVQMTLPYSVIRGEEIPIIVTVFNYLSSCVPIKLEINKKTKDYKVTSFYISKMCVCGDDGKSVKFRIIPKKLGHIQITVAAVTSEAIKLCPKSKVYAADAVKRKLLVEPEGIKQEYTKGTFFCADQGMYNETFDLTLPRDIIPGSVLSKVSVVGDMMGPALGNLAGLLAMPYGCGEQNMAKFAPNIYIMDYLTNTNQLTPKIKADATHFMNSGYQRELIFKRKSGSYSAFGNSDAKGSMMLTAFVVRSFARAQKYVFIDEDEVEHSVRWFKKMQKPSGCFPEYGRVFDRSLQGGLNSELTITAYVTVALLEADAKISPMVAEALDCISKKLDDIQDSYTTSLVAYTLVLANHPKAGIMMDRLRKKAVRSTVDQIYWSAKDGKSMPGPVNYYRSPLAADVEMTSYALLSYLKHKEPISYITMIVKWLSKQRNSYGGFSSTQDTCVALQALSEVAQKNYASTPSSILNISTRIEDTFRRDFKLTSDNKLILQRVEIPNSVLPNKLHITASGSGCVLFQASVKYNIPVPEEVPAFKLDVSVHRRKATPEEEFTACYPLQLKIYAKWLKEDVSNMAIVNVKLVSGFIVNEELLQEKLERSGNTVGVDEAVLKRYEIEGQNVILYFDEIKTMSISLDIIQNTLVKKAKPGIVRVYDYYDTGNQAKKMYNITEKDCYGEKLEKECPKCVSVDDFSDFFDKNINCSIYLMRTRSINGLLKVRKAYIKTDKTQNYAVLPYEIPEFCPCDEIYNGVTSLVLGQSDYFRKNDQKTSIILNSGTTIAKWNSKKMKKIFQEKMILKIYRRCWQLAIGPKK